MGRLRNLSASFKAAAFPPTASSPNSYNRAVTESVDEGVEQKNVSTAVRESTGNLVPDSNGMRAGSSAPRPNSMIYTPPTIGSARSDEVEELKPVFSYEHLTTVRYTY